MLKLTLMLLVLMVVVNAAKIKVRFCSGTEAYGRCDDLQLPASQRINLQGPKLSFRDDNISSLQTESNITLYDDFGCGGDSKEFQKGTSDSLPDFSKVPSSVMLKV